MADSDLLRELADQLASCKLGYEGAWHARQCCAAHIALAGVSGTR